MYYLHQGSIPVKRREILKTAFAGAGAITATATAQQAEHARHGQAKSTTAETASKPLLFDRHQSETVATIADLIIPRTDTPGARDAKVHEYIDLILKEGAAERRSRFIQGLGWIDGQAIRQHGKPFIGIAPAEQIALLKAMDGATNEVMQGGADFFRQIKQLTVQGYYTSKPGIDELNKGGAVPAGFGCKHEGSH